MTREVIVLGAKRLGYRGETTRVENRGETTRGKRPGGGGDVLGVNVLLPIQRTTAGWLSVYTIEPSHVE